MVKKEKRYLIEDKNQMSKEKRIIKNPFTLF